MNKIIVDIETIGLDFDDFDKISQDYLLKFAASEEEKEDVKRKLALYPLTGQIVTIGMLNPDSMKGLVLFQDNNEGIEKMEENGIVFEAGPEKEILKKFWEHIKSYDQVITFNGRGFDMPYLIFRSAVCKVRPTKNLMGYRYSADNHCDLLDQFTFYGAVRKFNLHFYAKALGLSSSKEGGMDGSKVDECFRNGQYLDIARYCLEDLKVTGELYNIWRDYIK